MAKRAISKLNTNPNIDWLLIRSYTFLQVISQSVCLESNSYASQLLISGIKQSHILRLQLISTKMERYSLFLGYFFIKLKRTEDLSIVSMRNKRKWRCIDDLNDYGIQDAYLFVWGTIYILNGRKTHWEHLKLTQTFFSK